MRKIRKGDLVQVTGGKDKGKRGKVLRFISAPYGGGDRVIVEGVRMVKRHERPNPKSPQGGIVEKEAPLSISQVMVVDKKSDKPTRIGFRVLEDGKKARVALRSGEVLA